MLHVAKELRSTTTQDDALHHVEREAQQIGQWRAVLVGAAIVAAPFGQESERMHDGSDVDGFASVIQSHDASLTQQQRLRFAHAPSLGETFGARLIRSFTSEKPLRHWD